MLQKLLSFVILLGLFLTQLFTLQRCANPIPPKGGPKDTIGPVVILDESTPNFQTNFRPERVEITFDEWVKLKDPTQVIISPPIDPIPKISLRKKSLLIDFGDAVLRDSATYVVNIGEAVVDLTESNPPNNVRFVFSTGPVLDSASVRGQLLDAYTKEPIEDALFALYENLADTAVRTENPFYFAKSDEDGNFKISNIRPGTYRGIALQNGNVGSYKFDDRATKQIGFPDTFITLAYTQSDTDSIALTNTATSLDLQKILLSDLDNPLRLLRKDTSNFGIIGLTFDRPASYVDYRSSNADGKPSEPKNSYIRLNNKDTLELFYQTNITDSLFFGLPSSPASDTLILLPKDIASTTTKGQPFVVSKPPSSLSPLEAPTFTINRPIGQVVDSLIQLRIDTFPELIPFSIKVDSLHPNTFSIHNRLIAEKRYELLILPAAIEDIFGKTPKDSTRISFSVKPISDFGTLSLNVTGLDSSQHYVFRLMKGKADTPSVEIRSNPAKSFNQTFSGLLPATYTLEIIEDRNANGRFDGADYDLQRQPEAVFIFELEALRADWEVESNVELKQ